VHPLLFRQLGNHMTLCYLAGSPHSLWWVLQGLPLTSWCMYWGCSQLCAVVPRMPEGKEGHLQCDSRRPQCMHHLAARPLLHQHSPFPQVEVWSTQATVGLLWLTSLAEKEEEGAKGWQQWTGPEFRWQTVISQEFHKHYSATILYHSQRLWF